VTPEGVRRTRLTAVAVGIVAVLLAAAAAVAVVAVHASFQVFRAGPGESELAAGSLALTLPVEGSDIRPGDVVSLRGDDGERFAGTVARATLHEDETTLVLEGRRTPYSVHAAQRVEGSLPYVGYVVSAVASPPGVVLLGAVLVVLGLLSPAVPELPGGRHRDRRRLLAVSSVRSSLD
jgi:hypothetical protein